MSKFTLLFFLGIFSLGGIAHGQDFERPKPKVGLNYPEYYCTNRGIRVEVDDSSCLLVGERPVLAVCDISLNNPMWRVTGETCTPSEEILRAAEGG